MKKRNALSLLKFAELFVNARLAYNNAKQDPEVRKDITKFGARGLWYLFLFAVIAGLGLAAIAYFVKNVTTLNVLFAIIMLIIGVYLMIWAIPYFFLALNLTIKQLCLNKKFIGWLDLVLIIAVIVAIIVIILLVFIKIKTA